MGKSRQLELPAEVPQGQVENPDLVAMVERELGARAASGQRGPG